MALLQVHAGDFFVHPGQFQNGMFFLWRSNKFSDFEKIKVAELVSVEKASEESVKKIGGTIGAGLVGAALLGPLGLILGAAAGGHKTEVTFIAVFKDGRQLFGTVDNSSYIQMMAAVMQQQRLAAKAAAK